MYKPIPTWCTFSQHHTKDFPWVPLAEFWAAPLLQDPDTTLWLSLELPSTRFQGVESWVASPNNKGCRFEKSILKHCEENYVFRFKLCRFKMVLIICFILKHLIYSWSWWYMQIFWKRSILDVCILLPSPSWAKLKVQSNHDPSLHFKEGTQDF